MASRSRSNKKGFDNDHILIANLDIYRIEYLVPSQFALVSYFSHQIPMLLLETVETKRQTPPIGPKKAKVFSFCPRKSRMKGYPVM